MAYEHKTYESILQEMIDRINYSYPDLDMREGSIIYNALAPAALELANAYVELDNVRNESFIATASREYALLLCDQMGMNTSQFNASVGTHKGEFDVEVDIGSRWNCGLYNYEITEFMGQNEATNYYEYRMVCETFGSEPNNLTGDLIPISAVVTNLTHAKIIECLIEGEDESSLEDIKIAYYNFVVSDRSDGNVAQYQQWCDEFEGIGRYKITPLWNGNNTVKVSILSASNGIASDELIGDFHKYLNGNDCYYKCTGADCEHTEYETRIVTERTTDSIVRVMINEIEGSLNYYDGSQTYLVEYGDYYMPDNEIRIYNRSTTPPTPLEDSDVIQIYYCDGMGNGKAPIGAFPTVTTAAEIPITISATVTMAKGYTDTTPIDDALRNYFSEIAFAKNQIYYMSIGSIILGVEGVESISNLLINYGTSDIKLSDEQIPTIGRTDWTVT